MSLFLSHLEYGWPSSHDSVFGESYEVSSSLGTIFRTLNEVSQARIDIFQLC